ncbi:MAG: hypothetical protein MRJ92_04735 [Nitrospira sp.]|nr:hypothetical protein [Nitrospira sp.]
MNLLGGVDLIKDDQSLGDHPFCPFKERVSLCRSHRRGLERDRTCLYAPHVFGPWPKLFEPDDSGQTGGAGAILICPGLTGYDAVAALSGLTALSLPLLLHPDFLGSHYVGRDSSIAPAVLFGLLPRLAGADISIYPAYGPRLSLSPKPIVAALHKPAEPGWVRSPRVSHRGRQDERYHASGDDGAIRIRCRLHSQRDTP